MDDPILVVLSNFPDQASAERAAHALLGAKAVACVNIHPAVKSCYHWNGKLEEAMEIPLSAKTTAQRYRQVEEILRHQHPYELPEIIALPVTHGLPAYLQWVQTETAEPSHPIVA